MGCQLQIEIVGDEDKGETLLDLICDETGTGYEPVPGGGWFFFASTDDAAARAQLATLLDRSADDWREHVSF